MGWIDKLIPRIRVWTGKAPADRNGAPGAAYKLEIGQRTEVGNVRDNNEDRCKVDSQNGLCIVADGMGGQAAGEQASELAVETVMRELANLPPDSIEPAAVERAIRNAVLTANEAIIHQGDADPSTQNMGTTIVLCLCRGRNMYIAHVGDSRAYLIRGEGVERITTDHNLAQALFEANTISEEELDTHRYRHVLWKYLGSKEVGDGPDINPIEIRPGDRFVLATDGVTGSLTDDMICHEVLREPNPQICAEKLVKLALENGSRDNVTSVVIYVQEEQP